MTIIEFYDKNAIENIAGAMMCRPERVILIGDNHKKMADRSATYIDILKKNSINTEILYTVIEKTNLSVAVKSLVDIVNRYEDCVFDITGGDEVYLVALGIVMERYHNVKCHRFNFVNDKITDSDSDGHVAEVKSYDISVDDNIAIYGGRYLREPDFDIAQKMVDAEFVKDVETLWDICKKNPGTWNAQIGIIGAVVDNFSTEDSLSVCYNQYRVTNELGRGKGWYRIQDWLLDILESHGLIHSLTRGDDVSFTFKNKFIKKCLTVSGQVLELFIALKLRGILDWERKPLYNDIRVGVVINWDDGSDEPEPAVINEIDVFAMKGAIPVFISCKNGFVDTDELYKLNTVADRFGGKYAKRVLVTSNHIDTDGKQEYLGERMKEMNILHINHIAKMSDLDLIKILSTLWKE